MNRTILKYAGNKSRVMSQINKFFDWEDVGTYIEPFCGAMGSVINANIPENVDIILADANVEIIDFYKTIKDYAYEVEQLANSWSSDEKTYLEIRSWDRALNWRKSKSQIEIAARTIYLNQRCFNGLFRINKYGFFTTPWNHRENAPKIEITKKTYQIDIIKRCNMKACDWRELLSHDKKNALIYADPPYIDIKSPESNFGGYIGNFSLTDQTNLAEQLLLKSKNGSKVIVSNSWCNESIDIYKNFGFNIHQVFANRMLSADNKSRGKTTELLATLNCRCE